MDQEVQLGANLSLVGWMGNLGVYRSSYLGYRYVINNLTRDGCLVIPSVNVLKQVFMCRLQRGSRSEDGRRCELGSCSCVYQSMCVY